MGMGTTSASDPQSIDGMIDLGKLSKMPSVIMLSYGDNIARCPCLSPHPRLGDGTATPGDTAGQGAAPPGDTVKLGEARTWPPPPPVRGLQYALHRRDHEEKQPHSGHAHAHAPHREQHDR